MVSVYHSVYLPIYVQGAVCVNMQAMFSFQSMYELGVDGGFKTSMLV